MPRILIEPLEARVDDRLNVRRNQHFAHFARELVSARLALEFPGLGEVADRFLQEKRIALADVAEIAAELVELRIRPIR